MSGGMLDPTSKARYVQNWNLTLERQFAGSTAISVAYVGNHALDIMGSRQFNPAIFGSGATIANENSRRLYPALGAVELASPYVYAEYESLQVNATKRFNKGVALLSNFTWGKTIDDTSSATEGNAGPPNPFNFRSARGPADFDQKFRFSLSLVYALPHINLTGFRNILLNDWQLNAITSLYSGLPFTVVSGRIDLARGSETTMRTWSVIQRVRQEPIKCGSTSIQRRSSRRPSEPLGMSAGIACGDRPFSMWMLPSLRTLYSPSGSASSSARRLSTSRIERTSTTRMLQYRPA